MTERFLRGLSLGLLVGAVLVGLLRARAVRRGDIDVGPRA